MEQKVEFHLDLEVQRNNKKTFIGEKSDTTFNFNEGFFNSVITFIFARKAILQSMDLVF